MSATFGTTTKLNTNTSYTSTTKSFQWWWVFIPIGVIALCLLITIGLEYHWAPSRNQTGGISAVLAAPIHYPLLGTTYVGSKTVGGISSLFRMLFESVGQAVSGPFNTAQPQPQLQPQ